jgi:hypothetical protein
MKIKLQDAKDIEAKITSLQTELMETLKLADEKGLIINEHRCKGTLDRWTYMLYGVKVCPNDLM